MRHRPHRIRYNIACDVIERPPLNSGRYPCVHETIEELFIVRNSRPYARKTITKKFETFWAKNIRKIHSETNTARVAQDVPRFTFMCKRLQRIVENARTAIIRRLRQTKIHKSLYVFIRPLKTSLSRYLSNPGTLSKRRRGSDRRKFLVTYTHHRRDTSAKIIRTARGF